MTSPIGGGVIEKVKRAIVVGLREVFDHEHPDKAMRKVSIDMEYPDKQENYPGIFVQFSLRKLESVDINQHFIDEDHNRQYMMWMFSGEVTVTMVALTSRERDRMADSFISTFAFGRLNPVTNDFYQSLRDNPDIYITVASYELKPKGQMTSVGTPWKPSQLAYEDGYSFTVEGQFASDLSTQELISLSGLRVFAGMHTTKEDSPTDYEQIHGEWI